MASVNVIKTRILSKYDLLANYGNFRPLKGEICVVEIPSSASNSGLTPPAIGIKVGNGTDLFSTLPWIQAVAGDIPAELKTAAGIDAEIAKLVASGRKLATVEELNALTERVFTLETRTTDSTIGNTALSARIDNKIDKTVAETATSTDKLIVKSTAEDLIAEAKSKAIDEAASSAANLYEKTGVAQGLINSLINEGQVKTNIEAISSLQTNVGDTSAFVGENISVAIKGLQDAVGTDAEGLGSKVSTLEGEMDEVQGTLTGYTSSKTVASAVADAKAAGTTAQTQVGTLGSLKTEAKTSAVVAINEVHDELDTANASLTSVTGKVDTLIGDDTSMSVRAIAAAETAKIVDGAPEAYNTLKEISDWIAAHPEDAASYAARINELNTALGGTGSIADGFTITPVDEQIDDKIDNYNNTIQNYLTAADTALQPADITTGSTNGSISVEGVDIKVHGLGTAAYTDSSNYATSEQGALADSAVQSVTILGHKLNNNGSVTVEQAKTDLGLKSAAYVETSAFDTAGSAQEVQNNLNSFKTNFSTSTVTGEGLVKSITYNENGTISATRNLITRDDFSSDSVFVFYCGSASGYPELDLIPD